MFDQKTEFASFTTLQHFPNVIHSVNKKCQRWIELESVVTNLILNIGNLGSPWASKPEYHWQSFLFCRWAGWNWESYWQVNSILCLISRYPIPPCILSGWCWPAVYCYIWRLGNLWRFHVVWHTEDHQECWDISPACWQALWPNQCVSRHLFILGLVQRLVYWQSVSSGGDTHIKRTGILVSFWDHEGVQPQPAHSRSFCGTFSLGFWAKTIWNWYLIGVKLFKPRPGSWYLLGVVFKISNEHPLPFYRGDPPPHPHPTPTTNPTTNPQDLCTVCTSTCFICSFELKVLGSVDVKQVRLSNEQFYLRV